MSYVTNDPCVPANGQADAWTVFAKKLATSNRHRKYDVLYFLLLNFTKAFTESLLKSVVRAVCISLTFLTQADS